MSDFNKIIFRDYKCFNEEIVLDGIKPINVIIGKNNIGKSSILDIVEMINNKEILSTNTKTSIVIDKIISENDISRICRTGNYGEVFKKKYEIGYKQLDNYEIGMKFVGQRIAFNLMARKERAAYSENYVYNYHTSLYNEQLKFNDSFDIEEKEFYSLISNDINFNAKSTKRIFAERNVVPEVETSSMKLNGYGDGITSIINNYLNKSKYNENLVKVELLNSLNQIMGEDAHFTEIITQQIDDGETTKWEVFLREETKGRIALSKSGSGLKTIIMVLVYTILIPSIEKKELSDYIYLFEELENNLHPSLERRLLKYVEGLIDKKAMIFLTTHSSTILDCFQGNSNVQVYNILRDETKIKVNILDDILVKNNCLNDLGVKASDILQSNGIIWVEGPSDRVYLNKWISLWSNGKYREGFDYSCVFYGGRLLSNITFDNNCVDDLVNLMLVNKNSIVLIDSDRKHKGAKINSTKSRIKNEFHKNEQLCIITQGREIENYLPFSIIKESYPDSKNYRFDLYDDIKDLLNKVKKDEGKRFEKDKKGYAQKFINNMSFDNMKNALDLDTNMKKIIEQIDKWNK